MSESKKMERIQDLEDVFKQHTEIVPKVKDAYHKSIAQVFEDLSSLDLEPIAAVLLKHEDILLDTTNLAECMRSRMTNLLYKLNDHFFEENDVPNKLITLEVLKDKFAPYRGTNWNVHELTPDERTRPLRIRLIDSSIKFLQKQLESQQKALEIALAKSRENRERIQNIQNERIKLQALIQQKSEHYKDVKPKLIELQNRLNEL
ncbi:uncharacterized protein LOC115634190 isoform X1 [Scaptodrosophila lebanonensis]|uniref:Uncharacterized protein LOC115634190 isoform X1 n=2 Tax=Drosophila lebanonensis TaxID=7225 RepID=A0A6J2UGN6_DROLE|nr:uncharacterized protein LOC115634190 isoform X1 [Scaptodrosophila lebanonensis]